MKRAVWVFLLTGVISLSAAGRDAEERFLKTARVEAVRPIGEGITRSLRATLSDGTTRHDAQIQHVDIYKAEYRTRSGVEKDFRDSWKFNVAAYLLDKLLDLNMVPPSVEREYNGKPGAFTWWVDDVMMSEKERRARKILPPDYQAWNNQFFNVVVFDQLIGNVDRTQENLLITRDWKVKMIDHTRAFRTTRELKDPQKLSRCDSKMLSRMKDLDAGKLSVLSPYLTPDQTAALLARRDAIVQFFERAVGTKGRDAVLVNLPRATPRVSVP